VPPVRTTTIVLDRPRGVLPPVTVATPWWPDVEPVVAAVHQRFGLDVIVLRLLHGTGPVNGAGSHVTYLAELAAGDPSPWLMPWAGELPDDPHRLPYACPGGPGADLAWAARHVAATAAPVQVKTWNLSSIWRLPTADGAVWLKHVPPFFAHEPLVIGWLSPGAPVPPLVAGERGRCLLADVPGYDCWDATVEQREAMVDALVRLQVTTAAGTDELLALGVHDWRVDAFVERAADVIGRDAPAADRAVLGRVLDDLPGRFAALAECGLPDGLVHGDFHPGNVRWSTGGAGGSPAEPGQSGGPGQSGRSGESPGRLGGPVLLDWGDCGIGHPLLDLPAFLDRAGADAGRLRDRWLGRWEAAVPGSDPVRAAALIEPLAALRHAIVYREFLDGIEASEHVYHRDDVPAWLTRAATKSLPGSGM
jgi:Phosphotransferase enzyme family